MKYRVKFFKGAKLFSDEICTYKNDFHLISCYILENLADVLYINKELILKYKNGNILKFKRYDKKQDYLDISNNLVTIENLK